MVEERLVDKVHGYHDLDETPAPVVDGTEAQWLEGEDGLDGVEPRPFGRGVRLTVVIAAIVLAIAACGAILAAFLTGSWWYNDPTDVGLSAEDRARVEAIRDSVDAGGKAPRALVWLDAALYPRADATAVRYHLIEAHGILAASSDPGTAEAAAELQAIIAALSSGSDDSLVVSTQEP